MFISFLLSVCSPMGAHLIDDLSLNFAIFGIDDLAAAALIGTAVSAIGGAFASSSSNSAASKYSNGIAYAADRQAEATKYSADQYIAGIDKTNEMNARENQLNRDFQWDMWNATNQYNSPSEEVKRMLEAGINPYIAKAGQPASMQSAPSSIAMQAPQQTPVPDYVTPAVSQAQVGMQGVEARNAMLNNTFSSISQGLLNASQMDLQSKRFGLDKYMSRVQEKMSMAQIKSLATQNLKLSNDMANDDARLFLQRRQSLDDLLTSSIGRAYTQKQIDQLDFHLNTWEREFQLAMYNAKTGRISANASAQNASTAARQLAHNIKQYYNYNLPNWDKLSPQQQSDIMQNTFDNVLNGLKLQNEYQHNENVPMSKWFDTPFEEWTPQNFKQFMDTWNPLRGLFKK